MTRAPTASSTPPTTSGRSTSCTSRSEQDLPLRAAVARRAAQLLGAGLPPEAGRRSRAASSPAGSSPRAPAFDIQCTEICGIGHALMPGRISSRRRGPRGLDARRSTPVLAAAAPAGSQRHSAAYEMPSSTHDRHPHRRRHGHARLARPRRPRPPRTELLPQVLLVDRPQDHRACSTCSPACSWR